jgi:hypothetical protein
MEEREWGASKLDQLVGKTVKALFKNDEGTYLRFVLDDDSEQLYFTEGDCCSKSWVEQIIGLEALIGQKINSVKDYHLETKDDPIHDVLNLYKCTLNTSAGRFDIEYRNASNGYYGGSIEFEQPDEHGKYGYWNGRSSKRRAGRQIAPIQILEDF